MKSVNFSMNGIVQNALCICQDEMYCTVCYHLNMKFDSPYERLQYARHQAGFKQATDAARHFSWNENTYRSHENGSRGINTKSAKKYAEKFKIRIEWLLYGWEPMNESDISVTKESILKKISQLNEKQQAAFETILDTFIEKND